MSIRTLRGAAFRRGFSLAEVSVASGLFVILAALLSSAWTGLGRPMLNSAYRAMIAKEAGLALSCLARDLGGGLPEGTSGTKNQSQLVGRTQPGGDQLWLCFDAGSSPNSLADWSSPDVVVTYRLVDGALVRSNQTTSVDFVVAQYLDSVQFVDAGGGVQITLNFNCHGVTQTYTLVAKTT